MSDLRDRAALLKSRWADRRAEPPRLSDQSRAGREAVGDLVASPAWARIQELKQGFVTAFRAPIPTKLHQQKPYETYCLIRDILDEFLTLVETDAALSSVLKQEEMV